MAEEHEVAQVQRQGEHVEQRAERAVAAPSATTPDAIDVTRNVPMIAAPATMRRSVSDGEGDADDGVEHGEQDDRDRHLPEHVEVLP